MERKQQVENRALPRKTVGTRRGVIVDFDFAQPTIVTEFKRGTGLLQTRLSEQNYMRLS